MSGPSHPFDVRIFVDEIPRQVTPGTSVAAAVAGGDADLAALLGDGRAYVTDGVGRPIAVHGVVFPGAIYRVVRSARRDPGGGA
jgi:hypothetical protein